MISPLVYLTIAFSLGIILGKSFSLPIFLGLTVGGIFLSLTAYAWIKKFDLTGFILILTLLAGLINFQVRNIPVRDQLAPLVDHGYVTLTGEVSGDRRDNSFPLNVSGETVTVFLESDQRSIAYGNQVKVRGILRQSTGFANPLMPAFGPRLTLSAVDCQRLTTGGGDLFTKVAIAFNHRFNATLLEILPSQEAMLLGSVVMGDKVAAIPFETKAIYRQAGLIHLLVASGTQVSILIGVCLGLCRFLGLSISLSVVLTTGFNLMLILSTGGGASIVRAAIMGEIAMVGLLFERDKEANIALALSALILMLIDPNIIFNIGFQLSFAATWGLINLSPVLGKGLLATSLAPLLATSPLIYYYFSQISPGALLSNLIVIPWVEFLTILGFITVLIGFICLPPAQILGGTLWLMLRALDFIARTVADLPGAYFFLPAPSVALVLGYYVVLLAAIELAKRKKLWPLTGKKVLFISGFILVDLVWNLAAQPAALGPKQLTVTFIDVGQGDSILIETPNGKRMLIDGGGRENASAEDPIGAKVVVPLLQRQGINKLDLVVATHPHLDHLGGLVSVLEKIKIDQVIENGQQGDSWAYRRFQELIKQNKIKRLIARAGQEIDFGAGVKARIFNPLNTATDGLNEDSIVLRLTYGRESFLFTGDLEQDGEEKLLRFPLRSTVLKVGHHGSRTSSSDNFLDAVKPRLAVISCGARNRFHHPHPSALKRLLVRGIKIWRTDQDGAIVIKTDGQRLAVSATGR